MNRKSGFRVSTAASFTHLITPGKQAGAINHFNI
jgi:hypothetical protein